MVVWAAGEHAKSPAETEILFIKKYQSIKIVLYNGVMANLLNETVVDYQGTAGNNSVRRTPPRVTRMVS